MILGGPKYSTHMFSYDKETRTFVTEASTIQRGNKFMGQLYDDSCDEGFTLLSHKTGAEVMYYYVDTVRDAEGEIIKWTFNEAITQNGKNYRTRVSVFND